MPRNLDGSNSPGAGSEAPGAAPRWLALLTLVYGVVLFLWLTPEDSIFLAAVLGALGSALGALHMVYCFGRRDSGRAAWLRRRAALNAERFPVPASALAGAGIGILTALCTALIMLVKTSLHSHLYPDYPLGVLIGILVRAPVWAAAGALAGTAVALWRGHTSR